MPKNLQPAGAQGKCRKAGRITSQPAHHPTATINSVSALYPCRVWPEPGIYTRTIASAFRAAFSCMSNNRPTSLLPFILPGVVRCHVIPTLMETATEPGQRRLQHRRFQEPLRKSTARARECCNAKEKGRTSLSASSLWIKLPYGQRKSSYILTPSRVFHSANSVWYFSPATVRSAIRQLAAAGRAISSTVAPFANASFE